MRLLRTILLLPETVKLLALARHQNELISEMQEEMERQKLEYTRCLRDLVMQFRIHLETPELDIREPLEKAIADLDDEVARIEEHVL